MFTRNLQLAVLVLFSIGLLSACGGSSGSGGSTGGGTLANAEASPTSLTEGALTTVTLTGSVSSGTISGQAWQQVSGPPVALTGANGMVASFSAPGLEVAVDTVLGFEFTVVTVPGTISTAYVEVVLQPATLDAFPLATSQIGGATTTGLVLTRPGGTYVIANVGGALQSTKLGMAKDVVHRLPLPGFASDVLLIEDGANAYVLVAAGHEGLLVVDATDPTNMQLLHQVHVNYFQDGLTFAEGGGSILVDQEIGKLHGPIIALAIDDTGTNLFLAGEEYGIHRTALTNVLGGAGPVLEPDGTLLIDAEVFTLQYAGEKPWGEPHGLTYVGGRLFAALGELGMAIYDPATLERVGAYNLYTDTSVTEDWFAAADISTLVQPGFLDPVTGMPDYQQASFELLEVMHGDTVAPTPWADFNITGRYYYHARQVVVAQQGARSIAYIAYALGGLVAVDVTGYGTATAGPGFLAGSYLGYLPAVPAHGPEHASTSHSSSLLPHFGSGRLKEAGYTAVAVSGTLVLATDHFAGLLVVDGADFPEVNWRGTAVPYDNDTDGIAGNHTPTMEAVTSFDMSPADPLDEESLPIWMYSAPAVLVTGEVGGHGAGLVLAPMWDFNASGGIDLVMLSGAGGMSFLDLDLTQILNADRFTGPVHHPTTEEIGAAPDGSPTQTISIGHADGVAVRGNYLFAADGPHGLSAWQVADASGMPLDGVHLVANTLQDEYPQDVGGVLAYPTPHAKKVTIPEGADYALVACAGAGVRRVDLTDVLAGGGTVGAPWFMAVGAEDIYEHKTRDGDPTPLKKQDHAHDVVVRGNLAFTADGSNGMTIYDLAASPTDPGGSFYV
ncbi:MAG: hypothetical protein P1V36_14475, partial [Planctomycetota bacterium]|nr:hypothetical protein [Planctomycetota bacterium]